MTNAKLIFTVESVEHLPAITQAFEKSPLLRLRTNRGKAFLNIAQDRFVTVRVSYPFPKATEIAEALLPGNKAGIGDTVGRSRVQVSKSHLRPYIAGKDGQGQIEGP